MQRGTGGGQVGRRQGRHRGVWRRGDETDAVVATRRAGDEASLSRERRGATGHWHAAVRKAVVAQLAGGVVTPSGHAAIGAKR